MKKKSLVYFQSGGPTTVINSSLLGVVTEAKRHPEIDGIFGAMYGVEGLIEDNLIDLRKEDQSDLDLLKHTPGAILGSTRRKMPGIEDPLFDKIIWTIQKHNIGYIMMILWSLYLRRMKWVAVEEMLGRVASFSKTKAEISFIVFRSSITAKS